MVTIGNRSFLKGLLLWAKKHNVNINTYFLCYRSMSITQIHNLKNKIMTNWCVQNY